MYRLIIVAVCIFFLGCGDDERDDRIIFFQPTTLTEWTYEKDSVNGTDREQLDAVALRMTLFLGRPVHFTEVEHLRPIDRVAEMRSMNDGARGGVTDFKTGEIALFLGGIDTCTRETPEQTPSWPDCFQAILLHEMLHALGVHEHIQGVGIMAPNLTTFDFTELDREACDRAPTCKE